VDMLTAAEATVETEIAAIREKHRDELCYYKNQMREYEGYLTSLMKKNREDLFSDKDKVDLLHGLLLYARGPHVVIPRDALGRIKEQGWHEGIRIAESVARDVVNEWPDEMLAVIGAKRAMKESFSYELKSMERRAGSGGKEAGGRE
jgi:hypothetical protein